MMNSLNMPAGRRKKLVLSIALASSPWLSLTAINTLAQSTDPSDPKIEHVLVVGYGASLDKAIQEQRRSDAIKSVISADAIAQLPDENVAEAVQRLPGVSIERDQGEGRFVSVRGLGPDLNSVSINGAVIPSPNSGSRAVALDVIPSELVESLAVVKAVTPDMDANSLGGSIDINSMSGFDRDGQFYSISAEGSYDDNTEETSPKLSVAFSDQFSIGDGANNLAIAVALSWQDRDFGSDNVETGGAWNFDDVAALEETELRNYTINRERIGAGINLDYLISEDKTVYLRTLYSEFTDTETRQATGVEFSDAQTARELGDAEGWRELKDRKETQKIESYVIGGDFTMNRWELSTQLGYSKSSEDTPGHIDGAKFEGVSDFSEVGFSSNQKPTIIAGNDFYDANQFLLEELEWAEQITTDVSKSFQFDLSRNYNVSGHESTLKFGAKYNTLKKDNDADVWKYEDFGDYGFSDNQLSLNNYVSGSVNYGLGNFGPSIQPEGLRQLIANLNKEEFYDEEESRIEDFVMEENITAAYLMNTVDIDKLRLIIGARFEGTEFTAKGTGLRNDDFESVSENKDYDHWLPNIHTRYLMGDNTQLRAAWTNTIVRPTFDQLLPGFAIDGDEAEFGNPQLKALESSNIDIGIEHYIGRAGLISAFMFYKDIENFIYETDVAGQGSWISFDEVITFVNGDSAELYGLELAWSQQLKQLPAPWNNLLLGANVTLSQSEATVSNGSEIRTIDLPYQSKKVGNFMIGWENKKLSLRLSANYKSSYLQEVATLDGKDHDLHVDEQTFLDFSARYYVTDQMHLTFEAQNITDETYYVYTGSESYNAQYEEYGPSYKLAITFTSL